MAKAAKQDKKSAKSASGPDSGRRGKAKAELRSVHGGAKAGAPAEAHIRPQPTRADPPVTPPVDANAELPGARMTKVRTSFAGLVDAPDSEAEDSNLGAPPPPAPLSERTLDESVAAAVERAPADAAAIVGPATPDPMETNDEFPGRPTPIAIGPVTPSPQTNDGAAISGIEEQGAGEELRRLRSDDESSHRP